MRGIALLLAGLLMTGCGRTGTDSSSNLDHEGPGETATANQPAPAIAAKPAADSNSVAQAEPVSACMTQGADRLRLAPIRAVGTEPFWGARVEGRCVTYSTPDNQHGVRVWTHYSEAAGGRATWTGQLDGKTFEMAVRAEAGCSDGMSDKRYPMAVDLAVGGEQRKGCAEPL